MNYKAIKDKKEGSYLVVKLRKLLVWRKHWIIEFLIWLIFFHIVFIKKQRSGFSFLAALCRS